MKTLVSVDYGMIDLPQLNWALMEEGKPAQYTYLSHVFNGERFDETYQWPIIKYDDKLGDVAATWAPKMTLA